LFKEPVISHGFVVDKYLNQKQYGVNIQANMLCNIEYCWYLWLLSQALYHAWKIISGTRHCNII